MQKIAGDGATVDGHFAAADAGLGQVATEVTADWCNAVQDEVVNVVQAAGLVLNPADNAQLLSAIRILQARVGRRNFLINGAFEITQRSQTGSTSNSGQDYCADRWLMEVNAGVAIPMTPVSFFNFTAADGPTQASRGSLVITDAQLGAATIRRVKQRIEDVRTLSGQKCTLSFWARLKGVAGATALTVTPSLRQYHGSGAGASADQITTLTALPLTKPASSSPGQWTRYAVTITLPSCGQIGASSGFPVVNYGVTPPGVSISHYLELRLDWGSASSSSQHILEISEVQLEGGEVATAFDYRTLAEEISLCERYYEQSWGPFGGPGFLAANPFYQGAMRDRATGTRAHALCSRFRTLKAKVPTMKWYSPQTGAADNLRWGAADVAVTLTNHPWIDNTGDPEVGSSQAEAAVFAHWTAEAEL